MEFRIENKKVALFMLPLLTQGGGAEKYFINLARNLRIRGIEADIITMDESFFLKFAKLLYFFVYHKWFRHVEISGRESEKTIQENLGKAKWIKSSWKDLKKNLRKYDVVYSKNEIVDLALLRARGYRNIPPVIVGIHTPIYFHQPKNFITKLHNFLYLGFFYKFLLKGTKSIHISNLFTQNLIKGKIKIKNELIYYPFSVDDIEKKSSENQSEIVFDLAKKNIIFVGRLSEQKGFESLVSILEKISKNKPLTSRISVNIFGSGDFDRNEKMKESSQRLDFIKYYGHVENKFIPNILTQQDFMITTSKWETLPFNVLEAQAMGLPVVAFDIPGPADIIEKGKTGFLVKNEDEFIEKITNLVGDKATIIKKDCIKNIQDKFNQEKIYGKIIEMFDNVLKKKLIINAVSAGRDGLIISWLIKLKRMESLGLELFLNGGFFTRKISLKDKDVYEFNKSVENFKKIKEIKWTKFNFMIYSLKRNFQSLVKIKFISNNFDIIYSPSSVLDLVVVPYLVKIFSRKKIKWVSIFDNIVPLNDPGNRIYRFLAWFFFKISIIMLKQADIIFASTPELRNYLIQKGFSEKKVIETGFAIENKMIEEAKPVPEMKIDALFTGRINETKGIYDMLEVLDIVRREYPDFQLAFLGGGDEETKKQFKEKIKERNLENNIQFLGFKTGMEKYNIIKSAKSFWFLSKSKSESFGIALLEAVCSGIPAFAYDLPQFTWLYPNGEVDISPMGDYRSVAEKVIELFESENFENKKGKLLLGKYSWEKIAETEFEHINKLFE